MEAAYSPLCSVTLDRQENYGFGREESCLDGGQYRDPDAKRLVRLFRDTVQSTCPNDSDLR